MSNVRDVRLVVPNYVSVLLFHLTLLVNALFRASLRYLLGRDRRDRFFKILNFTSMPNLIGERFKWFRALVNARARIQFEEPEPKAWIELEEGDICFDVGAHHGWYTILFGKKVGEKGLVVAVEPNPKNLNFLVDNVRLNKLKNVKIVACALCDKFGETQLWLGEHNGVSSIIRNAGLGSVTVKTRPLDSLLRRFDKVKLLKMDIENAELLVLSTCKLLGRVEKFIVEVHSPKNMAGLTKLFAGRGFKVKIVHGSRDFILATRRD